MLILYCILFDFGFVFGRKAEIPIFMIALQSDNDYWRHISIRFCVSLINMQMSTRTGMFG